ncbi:hypothetical protein DIPPA_14430 [Diplonema papillatum]|nr:hypothetical protein DIPPA_14430 [Diplonema papillatum]
MHRGHPTGVFPPSTLLGWQPITEECQDVIAVLKPGDPWCQYQATLVFRPGHIVDTGEGDILKMLAMQMTEGCITERITFDIVLVALRSQLDIPASTTVGMCIFGFRNLMHHINDLKLTKEQMPDGINEWVGTPGYERCREVRSALLAYQKKNRSAVKFLLVDCTLQEILSRAEKKTPAV